MIREFKPCTEVDIRGMQRKTQELRTALEALVSRSMPDPDYACDDLESLCRSLVNGQRNDVSRLAPGSWCVAPNIEGMDSDARVEFVFLPTYLAVAILTKALMERPELNDRIPGYEKVLRSGLAFSTLRELMGHGYDALSERDDAIRILEMGQAGRYLEQRPEACPELAEMLASARRRSHE